MLITRDHRVYHLNTTTADVFVQNGQRWDAPPWWELPDMVKKAVSGLLQQRHDH